MPVQDCTRADSLCYQQAGLRIVLAEDSPPASQSCTNSHLHTGLGALVAPGSQSTALHPDSADAGHHREECTKCWHEVSCRTVSIAIPKEAALYGSMPRQSAPEASSMQQQIVLNCIGEAWQPVILHAEVLIHVHKIYVFGIRISELPRCAEFKVLTWAAMTIYVWTMPLMA